MTDCPRGDMRDLLPDLLNERLALGERAAAARHVASCPSCAAELELLRSMRAALSTAPRVDTARIAAAVALGAPDVRPIRAARGAWQRTLWRAAAALALVAAGLSGWLLTRQHGSAPAPVMASGRAESTTVAVVTPPPPAPAAVPAHARAQPSGLTGRTFASAARHGLVMDGGVGDLSDGDVRLLLQSLDSLTAVPDADPAPMSYQIDDDGGVR